MKKKIAVLGSTGSLGKQSLDVLRSDSGFKVTALAAREDIESLEHQIRTFEPDIAAVENEEKCKILAKRLKGIVKTEVLPGKSGVLAAASHEGTDLVINTIVGVSGLMPTIAAINAGKDIALANKETLVAAGDLVMAMAREKNVRILPVDGEHSAIFQCLQGNEHNVVSKLLITASGGPFRGRNKEQLAGITPEEALKHPVWSMGRKISIDSATLMNKGLEVIEAHWLFGVPPEKIQVVVHPQSIVHSMVEFEDGAVIAQLSEPDMRLPVQYALNYPRRLENKLKKLDFTKLETLTFEVPDTHTFPCLRLAYDAIKAGGLAPAVLNAANETAAEMFLERKISFTGIAVLIENTLMAYTVRKALSVDDVLEADAWARRFAVQYWAEHKEM